MEKYMTLTVDEHMAGQTVEKVLRTALKLTKNRSAMPNFNRTGYAKTEYNVGQQILYRPASRS